MLEERAAEGAEGGRCPSLIGAVFDGDLDLITTIGSDHRTAPPDVRDRLSDAVKRIASKTDEAVSEDYEVAFLTTCGRVEIIGLGNHPESLFQQAVNAAGLQDYPTPFFQLSRGAAAIQHILRLASGLESELLGEYEIVSQIKSAFAEGIEKRNVGPVLRGLLDRSLSTSKRVRTFTQIGQGRTSVASLALQQALTQFTTLADRSVGIVGAGHIAGVFANSLKGRDVRSLTVFNRTLDRAKALADPLGAASRSLDELDAGLEDLDLLVLAVSSPKPILNGQLRRMRSGSMVVDLCQPRAALIEDEPQFTYIDLDQLSADCRTVTAARLGEAAKAEIIIAEETESVLGYFRNRQSSDLIADLMHQAELTRQYTLSKLRPRLGTLDEDQLRAVEDLTRRLVLGLLESPISGLKASGADSVKRSLVRELFGLYEEASE